MRSAYAAMIAYFLIFMFHSLLPNASKVIIFDLCLLNSFQHYYYTLKYLSKKNYPTFGSFSYLHFFSIRICHIICGWQSMDLKIDAWILILWPIYKRILWIFVGLVTKLWIMFTVVALVMYRKLPYFLEYTWIAM